MKDIPNASGIYKITCTANKKIYIGSAVNLRKRKNEHWKDFRANNKRHNPYIQRAWNKYGEESFAFEVLELVLPMSLTAREQYWFNKLKPFGRRGFNIAREAGSSLGVKPSLETRERLRQANLGRSGYKHTTESIAKMRGRKVSPEAVARTRQANLGRKPHNLGKKASPETREKLKQVALARERTPEQLAEQIERMRQANLGREKTPEEIEKLRQALHGRKFSPEHREKLRQYRLGRENSPEHIEKSRQYQIGREKTPEHREKIKLALQGKKKTPETIEKIRQAKLAHKKGA